MTVRPSAPPMAPRGDRSAGDARVDSAPRHTPGPWVYINSKPEGAPEWISVQKFIKAPNTIVENNRGPSYAREVFSDEDYPEKDADGALIAAAPDLLDALRDARDRMVGSSPGLTALIAKTDAAIRKALSDGSEAKTGGEGE